jgi:hypothetical protein
MRFNFAEASSSPPSSIMPDIPGIMDVILDKEPLKLVRSSKLVKYGSHVHHVG